jgi:hypothetical protein
VPHQATSASVTIRRSVSSAACLFRQMMAQSNHAALVKSREVVYDVVV